MYSGDAVTAERRTRLSKEAHRHIHTFRLRVETKISDFIVLGDADKLMSELCGHVHGFRCSPLVSSSR